MVLISLVFISALITVLCLASGEAHPPQSQYAVYRHAAVATDAAPCSVVGRYCKTSNRNWVLNTSPVCNRAAVLIQACI